MLPDLAAPLLGLAAATSWGAGDFCGGLASRRGPLLGVLAVTYLAGVGLVILAALVTGEPAPGLAALGWAAATGVAGTIGLAALYRGLAVGQMALVAPVSAVVTAAIPVAVALLVDGPPPPARLAGFGLALGGIWLVSRSGGGAADRQGLLLGLTAGVAFGAFLLLMHRASAGGTWWPLAAARTTSLALVLAAAWLRRLPWAPPRPALGLAALTGVLDAGGNALFVLASQAGRLDVAAVVSSMYPVATVILAAALLGERVSRPQGAGIAAVLGAIALIAG
jgi:drug/metabolite transporter (DMT)-like permease